jgi:proline iminopeptidase
MRRLLFYLCAVGAVGCAGSRSPVVAADALPPGLRDGSHEVTLNGVRHFYRVAGTAQPGAPPVVFLHGGPGQGSEHFDALAGSYLERDLRLVYFDQRGSGHSERPPSRDYALTTLVDDLEALRDTLGVQKLALVGHSFGGLLALEYAAKFPHNVSHLVFVSGLWDTDLQCRLRARRLAALRPEAYARVSADTIGPDGKPRNHCGLEFNAFRGAEREAYNLELMFPNPAIRTRIDSVNAAQGVRNTGEMSRVLFSGGREYQFRAYDRLTMPVLVIAGKHDGAAQPEGLRELAGRLPNARFLEYERSGHYPYLDEAERFARDLADWLRR